MRGPDTSALLVVGVDGILSNNWHGPLVSLTDRGRELRVRAAAVPAALFDRLGMSVEELQSLLDALTDVIAHAKEQKDSSRLTVD